MTATFEQSNQAFLQAAVYWLKAVLQSSASAVAGTRTSWFARRTRKATAPSDGKAVRAARAAMDQAAASDPSPAFVTLADRFGLSSFERDMLLLAAAMELDTSMPLLVASAHDDEVKRCPTFALGMSLFAQPTWDALSPDRPLRAHRLLEIHQSGAVSLLAASLRIDERIAAYIKGLNYLDERLSALVTRLPYCRELPPSQERIAQSLRRWLAFDESCGCVQLSGNHAAAKVDVVARAATLAGRQAIAMPVDTLPANGEEIEPFVRLWAREGRLLPLILLVQGVDGVEPLSGELEKTAPRPRGLKALRRLGVPCLIDIRRPLPDFESAGALSIDAPTEDERRVLWDLAFGRTEGSPGQSAIARLAGEFKTSVSQLDAVAARAGAITDVETDAAARQCLEVALAGAWGACVEHAGASLAGITRWIQPRATIDDVKLPVTERAQLERLVSHARHRHIVTGDFGFGERGGRGLGLAALFHGESGTGKTLAAEAVAQAMSLALAVIDLATVKSKYIGETEKNLRRIFDAAEQGGAVLFFDEADALFGKRSEVKDSHDRYANIEINYLLARMENFSGVAILATNMKHALDPAFMRRLRFVVSFPFPGVAERKAIWQSVFPTQTPLGELDFERLARFSLTGGSIFNAALAAAHAAAASASRVEMPHVLDAIRWELRKLERPIAEAEFRWPPGSAHRADVAAA